MNRRNFLGLAAGGTFAATAVRLPFYRPDLYRPDQGQENNP
ncbi:hypothetical protein [Rhizobium chutanense]|nr:hypothetical protein [Rhizobium chutanense]